MSTLAFAAAGAAAGFFVGGPTGAQLGWAIGSAIGGMQNQKDTRLSNEGPRIYDLKVQVATYGQSIPKVFGRVSIAGNLIWSSDIIESVTTTEQEQESGGKGGGSSTIVTSTTYSYSAHLAIGICEGVIGGVRKIWCNGKLIYNVGESADAATVYASNSRADGIRFYFGTTTQLPDPIIEAYQGVGNVPGYRNLAYVVFENFQLADFGNRIPNFEFEVVSSSTTNYLSRYGASNFLGTGSTFQSVFSGGVLDTYWTAFTTPGGIGSIQLGYRRRVTDINGVLHSYVQVAGIVTSYNTAIDVSNPTGNWPGVWLSAASATTILRWRNYLTGAEQSGGSATDLRVIYLFKAGEHAIAISADGAGPNITLHRFGVDAAKDIPTANETIAPVVVSLPDATAYTHYRPYFDGTHLWIGFTKWGVLQKYDLSLTLVGTWTFTPVATTNSRGIVIHGDRFFYGRGPVGNENGCAVYQLNADFTTTLLDSDNTETGTSTTFAYAGGLVVGWYDIFNIEGVITAANPLLSTVAQELCLRAGLTAADIDVGALASDSVTGYVIGRRGPLSSALQPLMTTYFFDCVESDGKLKFRKRNGSSAVTFDSSRMTARAANDSPGDLCSHSRQDDLELPVEVAVLFMNDNAAYEQGAQYARRLTTQVDNRATFELPLVLTDTQAKRIADTLIFDAWAARDTFTWRSDRTYAKYDAGDIVTVPLNATESLAVRVTKRDDGANGVIAWNGTAVGDSAIYTQASNTQDAETPPETISMTGPTLALLMDIPLLREQDDDYGMYAGVNSFTDGWTGASLYKSIDNGSSYLPVEGGAFVVESVSGAATTVLATTTVYDRFDETNSVTVTMIEGTLASITRDQMLNGLNVALLGSEIIQFQTATLVGAGLYTLTSLLRARFGTDWAVGTHAQGERFVMLDPSTMRFIRQASTDVGVSRLYKPVSSGALLSSTASQAFTYNGENLECLAPVHVGGGRNVALDLTINWKRRTRLSPVWRDYVEVPLGETTESYEIDIMQSTTVKRTITAVTNTASYTAAQQVTDFGSAQASISVRVYQLSSRVGRGHVAAATI